MGAPGLQMPQLRIDRTLVPLDYVTAATGGSAMIEQTSVPVQEIDLASLSLFAEGCAHEAFRRLRAEAPVAWNPGKEWFPGFWSITKYEDVRQISRDPAGFSSAKGITMMVDPENPGPAAG